MALMVSALTGCKDGENILVDNYIKLSESAYTFDAVGAEALTVKVDAQPVEWTAEPTAEWISIKQGDNSVEITVADNDTNDLREATIVFTAGKVTDTFTVSQLGKENAGVARYRLMDRYKSFVISPGGVCALAVEVVVNDDGTQTYQPYIINLADDKATALPVPDTRTGVAAIAVTDGGEPFLLNNGITTLYLKEGVWTAPDKIDGRDVNIQSVSADGRVWVGFYYDNKTWFNYPVKWIDGVPEVLKTPDVNGKGQPIASTQGFMARGCSTDGSIVYGSCWGSSYEAIWWDAAGDWHWVADKSVKAHEETVDGYFGQTQMLLLDTPQLNANQTLMATDGTMMACDYQVQLAEDMVQTTDIYPMFYDTADNTYKIIDTADATGTGATDDYGFWATPALGPSYGYVYDKATDTSVEAKDWIQENYGLTMTGDNTIYVVKSYAGGKVLYGRRAIAGSFIDWYIYAPSK
jgi:hypothetical protein